MRVLMLPADKSGCGLYRMFMPGRTVTRFRPDITFEVGDGLNTWRGPDGHIAGIHDDIKEYDLVIFQRPLHRDVFEAMQTIQKVGVPCVVELDDDIENVDRFNQAWVRLHPRRDPLENWTWCRKAAAAADLVTVSTPALRRYAPHGRVRVIRNAVPQSLVKLGEERQTGDRVIVGWSGTIATHPFDLDVTHGGVGRALTELHDEAQFRVVGDGIGVAKKLGLSASYPIDVRGWVDLQSYPTALAEFDVGIAPLASTAFNRAKCLDTMTRVTTDRGLLPIGEIMSGDRVWRDGRWRDVTAVSHEIATPGVEISTRFGYRLRLTADHRLWSNGAWRRACDLSVGDRLSIETDVIPDNLPLHSWPWPADSRRGRATDVDPDAYLTSDSGPRITLDERWARLLGLYTGDGSCSGETAVVIHCDGVDLDLISLIEDDWRAVGLRPYTQSRTTYTGAPLRKRYVSVSSAHLRRVFTSLGLVAENRRVVRVPDFIWTSPRRVVSAYLAGLFEADGTAHGTCVDLCTKQESLARDVHRLLTALGIVSRVRARKTGGQSAYRDREYWHVYLGRAAVDVFAKEVGFISERKRVRLEQIVSRPHSNAYRPMIETDEIASIVTRILVQPVDLQVAGESFAAAGIVSHNSALKPMEFGALGIPTLCSPTDEYLRFAREGIGIICSRGREWERETKRLIRDADYRREAGDRAHRAVTERHMMVHRVPEWVEAWEAAASMQPKPKVGRGRNALAGA